MRLDRPFKDAFLVINYHGGHRGIWRAGVNGHPQVHIPTSFADQLHNALMVQEAKLGKVLLQPRSTDEAAVQSFMETVWEVSHDRNYEHNAKTCQKMERYEA